MRSRQNIKFTLEPAASILNIINRRPAALLASSIFIMFGGAASAQMFPSPQVNVSQQPLSVATIDLNNDGKNDIITLNQSYNANPSTLAVSLGAPAPLLFTTAIYYPAATNPIAFATGDITNDGKIDVLVASSASNVGIRTHNGDGAGGFTAGVVSATLTNPNAVSLGDFNLDGKLDAAVGDSFNIQILLGDTTGAFTPHITFSSGPGVFAIRPQDLDADGIVDLTIAHSSGNVIVQKGFANGTFATQATLVPTSSAFDATIVDLNNDGKSDIVSCNYGIAFSFNSTISSFMNLGGGTFGSAISNSAGNRARAIASGDLNGDGQNDVAVVNDISVNTMRIFLGNGNGTFAAQPAVATAKNPRDISIAELTGDGIADIAVANYDSTTVTVFVGNGPAGIVLPVPSPLAGNHAAGSDLNNDGFLDLVTVGSSYASPRVYSGNGAGAFTQLSVAAYPYYGVRSTIGDVNNDQTMDIVVTVYDNSTGAGKLGVLKNNGNATFQQVPLISYQYGLGPVSLGDLNSDGNLDVVAGIYSNFSTVDGIYARLGDGQGGFFHPVTIIFGDNPESVELGDYNHDGNLDVATPNSVSGNVAIYIGNGLGSFAAPTPIAVLASSPMSACQTDIDQDGNIDFIVGYSQSSSISILNGNGAGGFSVTTIPGGTDGYSATLADVNQDGIGDLLVNGSTRGVGVNVNSGISNFTYLGQYGTSGLAAAADVNADGRVDLITGSFPDFYYAPGGTSFNLLNAPTGVGHFGDGTAGCRGKIGVSTNSPANINNQNFAIVFTNAPRMSLGLCIITNVANPQASLDPFGLGVLFNVDFFNSTELIGADIFVDGSGAGRAGSPVPNSPNLVSLQFFAQGMFLEPADFECSSSPYGLVTSFAGSIVILP